MFTFVCHLVHMCHSEPILDLSFSESPVFVRALSSAPSTLPTKSACPEGAIRPRSRNKPNIIIGIRSRKRRQDRPRENGGHRSTGRFCGRQFRVPGKAVSIGSVGLVWAYDPHITHAYGAMRRNCHSNHIIIIIKVLRLRILLVAIFENGNAT